MALAARLAAPDAPRPPQGGTPLHHAARSDVQRREGGGAGGPGRVESVKALVGLGAAVDARDVSWGKG